MTLSASSSLPVFRFPNYYSCSSFSFIIIQKLFIVYKYVFTKFSILETIVWMYMLISFYIMNLHYIWYKLLILPWFSKPANNKVFHHYVYQRTKNHIMKSMYEGFHFHKHRKLLYRHRYMVQMQYENIDLLSFYITGIQQNSPQEELR